MDLYSKMRGFLSSETGILAVGIVSFIIATGVTAIILNYVSITPQFWFSMLVSLIGIIFGFFLKKLVELGQNRSTLEWMAGCVLAGIFAPFILVPILLFAAFLLSQWQPIGEGVKQGYMFTLFSTGVSFLIGYLVDK